MKAILAEDNEIERRYLWALLKEFPDIELMGEASNGREALELVVRVSPDLVFLDINMPELDGLELARRVVASGLRPFLVFVTVDRNWAPEAFDLDAVDYLVKPYDAFRLGRTLARVRQRLRMGDHSNSGAPGNTYGTKLAVKVAGEVHLLEPKDIIFIQTEKHGRISIHTENEVLRIREDLGDWEKKLAVYPNFLRSHRSFLINLDWVKKLTPWTDRSYRVIFRQPLGEKGLQVGSGERFHGGQRDRTCHSAPEKCVLANRDLVQSRLGNLIDASTLQKK
ncbi:MAG: LytTR family DNA-binding domain-containing protein [Candidatus Methanomethyliaceae archaeon]